MRDTTIYFRYKFGIKMIHVMITRLLFPERTFQSITIWIPICTYKWKSTHLHNTYWHISLNSSISTHLYINRLICRLSCSICIIYGFACMRFQPQLTTCHFPFVLMLFCFKLLQSNDKSIHFLRFFYKQQNHFSFDAKSQSKLVLGINIF